MTTLLKKYREFDPAAKSNFEILFLYPGFKALMIHQFAHYLYSKLRWYFVARLVSEFSRFMTGIEIHPGAKIAKTVIIEHGTGVVIGETAEVEDHVVILQGVTLGSRRVTEATQAKRHPTIRSNASIGAGSKILGPITIGENAWIGANSVVLDDIAPYSTAVGMPAKMIDRNSSRRTA